MPAYESLTPDWRDPDVYAPLLKADRSAFAWEWLRRNAQYVECAREARNGGCGIPDEAAAPFGLHAFEPPERAVPLARPMWRAETGFSVLRVSAHEEGEAPDYFDLDRLARFATLLQGLSAQHLLLSNGWAHIRLDVVHGSVASGPCRLSFHLSGFEGLRSQISALQELAGLWRTGGFSRRPNPRQRKAARLIMTLRVHDAIAGGTPQREIARLLFPSTEIDRRWRVNEPSMRLRVQRLVRAARIMAGEGYHSLLE